MTTIRETREAGGRMLTCVCGWLRWTPSPVDADRVRAAEHGARCKVGGGES